MHYQMLIRLVNAEMGQIVNAIPSPSQNQHCDDMIPLLPITLYESTPINGRKYQNAHQPPTFSFDPKVLSNYLCSKCPCCFRSSFTLRSQLSAHCIIVTTGSPGDGKALRGRQTWAQPLGWPLSHRVCWVVSEMVQGYHS